MPTQKAASKRHFTDAARAAAVEARRRKREAAPPSDALDVFVIRSALAGRGYGWEIRRYGGVVLDRSSTDFSTMQGARSAGNSALSSRGTDRDAGLVAGAARFDACLGFSRLDAGGDPRHRASGSPGLPPTPRREPRAERRARVAGPRLMSFELRPLGGDAPGERWHWMVYEDPHGCFIRNGQVAGPRGEADRAARAAIAAMGGTAAEVIR